MIGRTVLTLALAAALAGEVLAGQAQSQPQVNINTATAEQLMLLPRVGPALASRIIEFREANGPFKAPEELVRVKGVGERSFELLQPYVAVKGDTTLKEKVKVPRSANGDGGGAAAEAEKSAKDH